MTNDEYTKFRLFHAERAIRHLMAMLIDVAPHLERPIWSLGNAWDKALDDLDAAKESSAASQPHVSKGVGDA